MTKGSIKPRGTRGFTVIEILFAISLTVTAMAIVGPPTARALTRISLRGATDEVAAAHSFARTVAVRYGRRAELEIVSSVWDTQSKTMAGILSIEADTSENRSGPVVLRRTRVLKGTLLSDRARLCFDARGLPTTEGRCEDPKATIVVRIGDDADTVRLSALGHRIR